jgi:hypothetical protein
MSVVSAFWIAGSDFSSSKWTSTTAPSTWDTRPTAAFCVVAISLMSKTPRKPAAVVRLAP